MQELHLMTLKFIHLRVVFAQKLSITIYGWLMISVLDPLINKLIKNPESNLASKLSTLSLIILKSRSLYLFGKWASIVRFQ